MAHDPPSARELVQGVLRYLEAHLAPTLSGAPAYDTRVAIHVLRIVARELGAPTSHAVDERLRLADLLAKVDGAPEPTDASLAIAIRDGAIDAHDARVLAHLRATATARLAVDNPTYRHVRRTP